MYQNPFAASGTWAAIITLLSASKILAAIAATLPIFILSNIDNPKFF